MDNNNQNMENPRRSRFNFTNNRLQAPAPLENDSKSKSVPPAELKSVSQPHLGGRKQQHTDKTGPLIFNVSTLLRDHEGSHRNYDFEQAVLPLAQEEGEKPDEATEIAGHVRFTKVRHDVLVQGSGEAEVVLECVRCLNEYTEHIEYDLEEIYRPSIDVLSGLVVKVETPDDEDYLKLDANHLLNLGEAIRQQILVSLPINSHHEDCPGLSDVLERVNQTTTVEDEEPEAEEVGPVDKRWAALSQLLGEDKPK